MRIGLFASDDAKRRLVRAARIGSERIPGGLECAGARATANRMVLAAATSAFELCRIMQRLEDGRIAINVGKAVATNIADSKRQKSGRTNLSGVRHKDNPVPVADSEAPISSTFLNLLSRHPFRPHSFERDATIRRRLCRGDYE